MSQRRTRSSGGLINRVRPERRHAKDGSCDDGCGSGNYSGDYSVRLDAEDVLQLRRRLSVIRPPAASAARHGGKKNQTLCIGELPHQRQCTVDGSPSPTSPKWSRRRRDRTRAPGSRRRSRMSVARPQAATARSAIPRRHPDLSQAAVGAEVLPGGGGRSGALSTNLRETSGNGLLFLLGRGAVARVPSLVASCAPLLTPLCAPGATFLTSFRSPASPFLTSLRARLRCICGRRRGRGGRRGGLGFSRDTVRTADEATSPNAAAYPNKARAFRRQTRFGSEHSSIFRLPVCCPQDGT